MDSYIKQTVCIKYHLDELNKKYLYCIYPPKESEDNLPWRKTIYGEIPFQQHAGSNQISNKNDIINHLKTQGFWHHFQLQTVNLSGKKWYVLIGVASVNQSAGIETGAYMKVIDCIFKREPIQESRLTDS